MSKEEAQSMAHPYGLALHLSKEEAQSMAHLYGLAPHHNHHTSGVMKPYKQRERVLTQAEEFDHLVKDIHGIPDEKDFVKLGVEGVYKTFSPFGAGWKISQLFFEDGSYYNVGQPQQGPQTREEEENVISEER